MSMAPHLRALTVLWAGVASNAVRQVGWHRDVSIDAVGTFHDIGTENITNNMSKEPGKAESKDGKFVYYYDDDTTNFDEFMLPSVRNMITVGVKSSPRWLLEKNNPENPNNDDETLREYVKDAGEKFDGKEGGLAQWLSTGYGAKMGGHRMIGNDVHLDPKSGITVSELEKLKALTSGGLLQAVIFDWDRTLTVANGLPCPKGGGLSDLKQRLDSNKIKFDESDIVKFFFGLEDHQIDRSDLYLDRHTVLSGVFQLLKASPVKVYILTKNSNKACMTDFINFGLLDDNVGKALPDGWKIISTKGNKYEAFRAEADAETLGLLKIEGISGKSQEDNSEEELVMNVTGDFKDLF